MINHNARVSTSTTTSGARTTFYQYRKDQQCSLLQIRKKTYYILPDQTAQSDQCFPTREYAISLTCFAAHFTSIKDTRAPRVLFLPSASTDSVDSKALQRHLLGWAPGSSFQTQTTRQLHCLIPHTVPHWYSDT